MSIAIDSCVPAETGIRMAICKNHTQAKAVFLGFLAVLLVGCGKPVRELGPFESYVTQFEKASTENGKDLAVDNLVIEFGSIDPLKLATCTHDGIPTITVSKSNWDTLDEDEREKVLYHELGHCVLDRRHDDEKGSGREWKSLMIPYPGKISDYKDHKKEYIQELFSSN
jgi:hypothetical protein